MKINYSPHEVLNIVGMFQRHFINPSNHRPVRPVFSCFPWVPRPRQSCKRRPSSDLGQLQSPGAGPDQPSLKSRSALHCSRSPLSGPTRLFPSSRTVTGLGRQVQLFLPTLFIAVIQLISSLCIFKAIFRNLSCISPHFEAFLDWRAECDNFQGFRGDTAGCMTPSPLFLFSDVPSWVDRRRSLQLQLPTNKEEKTCWSRVRTR